MKGENLFDVLHYTENVENTENTEKRSQYRIDRKRIFTYN